MKKSIKQRVDEVMNDPTFTDKNVEWLESTLRGKMEICGTAAMQSYFLFGIFWLAWVLLRFAALSEVSVLGVKIANLQVVALLLPVVSAFCLYRYQCLEALAGTIDILLKRVYQTKFKAISDVDIDILLTYTSTHTVDHALSLFEPPTNLLRKISEAWLTLLAVFMTIIPIVGLAWMIYSLVKVPPINLESSLISAVITGIFAARSLIVFTQFQRTI